MTTRPVTIREIEMQARSCCEALVRECLPNAVKDGNYLRVGSIAGERGQSLAVNLAGASRGMWTDFSASPGSAEAGGDMICLVELTMFAGDRGKAVAWLKSWLGLDHLDPTRLERVRAMAAERDRSADEAAEREAEAKKRGARALWLNGSRLVDEEGIATPGARYYMGRGLALPHWPGSLRYHAAVWNRDAGVKLPAIVAQMVTPEGAHVATHRTWIGRDADGRWVKADAAGVGVPRGNAKKVLGKCGGAFVPIARGASDKPMSRAGAGETLFVTEGIEDALTVAMIRPGARVAAAYSLRNLGAIQFPPAIATIVLVADRDDGEREQAALEQAIARQQARGHEVRLVMPPPGIKDINAWLLAERSQLGAAA